ncbi:hypothetical protein KY289_021736 [Solanum tuberosum]|nr:hypothetical protein KY289_021736 [Solanum tuberosum]
MIDKVDLIFHYGGTWVISPELLYNQNLVHVLSGYEANNVRFADVCEEFTKNLGFTKVNQHLVTGPSGWYYLVTDDDGMRTLQYLFSKKFRVINFFAVNSSDLSIFAQNITYPIETYTVDVEVASDQESSSSEFDESDSNDYNEEELEVFSQEKKKGVTDTLENYKVLEKGQTFKDISEARRVISFYAMANRYGLRVKKIDTTRAGYKCVEGCPFTVLVSKDKKSSTCSIKSLNLVHTCDSTYKNPRANANTLAHLFKRKVQYNPQFKVKDMREELETIFNMNVSTSKVKRAKRLALEKLEGSFLDDYNKLEAYGQELRTSNPGSDVVINRSKEALLQGKRTFLRMYICFKALKDGWKSGLRPLIGLDGTFLKGRYKGQLLVATGQDCMNQFYPIAWAVVDKETARTWEWFLELLKCSLNLKDGHRVTFISDMQKGLIDAKKSVFPEAKYRYCVRHIEANWCKRWRSGQAKKLMWWCAWATYVEDFEDQLRKLGDIDEKAVKDLMKYKPQTWCRAYFDTQCKNIMVDNNFTESFNAWILEARHMPIIKMLEEIRLKVMRRLVSNEAKVRSWKREFSPPCIKLYNVYRAIAHGCKVEFNGDFGYEVTEGDDRHTINLKDKRCTCRAWDLSGIPSPHAIKAMLYDKDNTQGASSSSRNCKKKCNDTTSTPRVHHSGDTNDEAKIEFQTKVGTQQSFYSTTQPYDPEVSTEEDPSLRPVVVSEVTRLEERKKKPKPTIGSMRIGFTGDASGV